MRLAYARESEAFVILHSTVSHWRTIWTWYFITTFWCIVHCNKWMRGRTIRLIKNEILVHFDRYDIQSRATFQSLNFSVLFPKMEMEIKDLTLPIWHGSLVHDLSSSPRPDGQVESPLHVLERVWSPSPQLGLQSLHVVHCENATKNV